jgi:hypothetical protein
MASATKCLHLALARERYLVLDNSLDQLVKNVGEENYVVIVNNRNAASVQKPGLNAISLLSDHHEDPREVNLKHFKIVLV